ncbi:hypothetical protein D0T84_14855 [Dysgonomonas sp. 521]|uniref:DUF6340 family protein n=1 Tax=Dysgonomonas sp. 521 TaxID=2302932 RepID=UPI0013D40CBA|nr:DUF6340 family protein [Dysgonomonas sp. 521]NDV96181.1 hypothetical protein [Dysgonomonas sp. 521]
MVKYISGFLFALLFTSCVTTNVVSIDVREPAIVSFDDPQTKKVIIVNNSASQADEDVQANGEKQAEISVISTDSAKILLINSLSQYMGEEKYFSGVEIYPHETNRGKASDIKPLSARNVQTICREKNADILISLDLFVVSAELESVNVDYFNNYNLLSSKLGALLRVYAMDGSRLAPPIAHVDSLYREASITWNNIKNSIPEINDLVTEITMKAADELTGTIIPSWSTQTRWYYSDNSGDMKNAAKLAGAGKWLEAADIWGTLYDKEKNITKKIRLASNLALANEYLDDVGNALSWINVAYDLIENKDKSLLAKQVAFYRQFLIKREDSMYKLYQQLGIEEDTDE